MNIPDNLATVPVVIYGNSGGIANHKDTANIVPYSEHAAFLTKLMSDQTLGVNPKLRWYGFDSRINRDVWMLVADHSGHTEQFVRFLYLDVGPWGTRFKPTLNTEECQSVCKSAAILADSVEAEVIERQYKTIDMQVAKVLLLTGNLQQKRSVVRELGLIKLSHIQADDDAAIDRFLDLLKALS